ncbi:MAG: protein translocase subunit SecF, partial [Alphaproteobacteria bacterium]
VDFKGGVLIEVRMNEEADVAGLRSELGALGLGEIGLQSFGEATDILITLPKQNAADDRAEAEAQKAAIALIQKTLGVAGVENGRVEEYRRVETVGPSVSEELKGKALWATIYALLGIAIYIGFRFEWRFAVAALAALTHDVITTLGLFAVTGFEFNLTTVAAILTIAGYSINDTVVVFDRAREELRRYKKKPTIEILNIALNRTLTRTLMTSVTTLLALFALAFFGGPVIRGLSVALIWGVLIGTYSSLFLATPMLLIMKLKRSVFDESEKTAADDGAAAFVQKLAAEEKAAKEFNDKQGPDEEVIPPEFSARTSKKKTVRKPKRK